MNKYKLVIFENFKNETTVMILKNGTAFESLDLYNSEPWYNYNWGLISEKRLIDLPWIKSVDVLDEWEETN